MMLTLWDLIEPIRKRLRFPAGVKDGYRLIGPAAAAVKTKPQDLPPPRRKSGPEPGTAQARYEAVARQMLDRYQIRVRKWRTGMSGIAWYVTYTNGKRQNLIEAPRPKGPMSIAVFLHEIGHHAIGFDVYKPRCLEEYHAWRWAIKAMEEHGLNITDQVRYRMHGSLHYAVQKAKRRGIKVIPPELTPYLSRPVKPRPVRSR